MKILKRVLAVVAAALPALSHAGYLPYGMQSNVSVDTVNSWGWQQCYSWTSGATSITTNALPKCSGDYLMMGLLNSQTNNYVALGAGDYSIVTAWTNTPIGSSFNNVQSLDNWSNGLNFYRTANWISGGPIHASSWGFTTNSVVNLYINKDLLLDNGYRPGENTGGTPSTGISLAGTGSDSFVHASYYNTTGYNYTWDASTLTKVLLSLSGPLSNTPPGTDPGPGDGDNPGTTPVPEPSSLALFGLGIGGMGLASRRRRQMA